MKCRWMEFVLFGIAALGVWRIHTAHQMIGRLEGALQTVVNERDALSRRWSAVEHDLRYYKMLGAQSSLHSSVMLEGIDLDSTQMSLRFAELSSPLLLYSIDPACAVCIGNLPFINELDESTPCGMQVIGVAVAGWNQLEDFRSTHKVKFPVLRQASGNAWQFFPISISPVAVVLGAGGTVEGWWTGEITPKAQDEILRSVERGCALREPVPF